MHNRKQKLAAVLVAVAFSFTTAACTSTYSTTKAVTSGGGVAGGSSGGSSGGSTGGSGGSGGNDSGSPDSMGDILPADLGGAAVTEANNSTDHRGEFGSEVNNSAEIGACKFYFGISPSHSATYLVSADKYGIGGQMGWACNQLNSGGVLRINQIKFWLESSPNLASAAADTHWTKESEGTGNKDYIDPPGSGTLIVYTNTCKPIVWRAVFTVVVEMANQGIVTQTVHSQWRKITDADCARE